MLSVQGGPPVHLPIELRLDNGIPLYVQLTEQIRVFVHEGVLHPKDPMPTVRGLAVQLGINANTVAKVYRKLQSDGLQSARGDRSQVHDRPQHQHADTLPHSPVRAIFSVRRDRHRVQLGWWRDGRVQLLDPDL